MLAGDQAVRIWPVLAARDEAQMPMQRVESAEAASIVVVRIAKRNALSLWRLGQVGRTLGQSAGEDRSRLTDVMAEIADRIEAGETAMTAETEGTIGNHTAEDQDLDREARRDAMLQGDTIDTMIRNGIGGTEPDLGACSISKRLHQCSVRANDRIDTFRLKFQRSRPNKMP